MLLDWTDLGQAILTRHATVPLGSRRATKGNRQLRNRHLYLGVSPGVPAVRFRSLDFMRGVGALAVVFAHALVAAPYFTVAGPWFAFLVQHTFWLAATALPMFFVVSGFCIHLAQIRHEGGLRFRFVAFWRRRMWRLYPTYFVAVCCSMGLLLLMWAMGRGAELLSRYPEPFGAWLAADFVTHVLMLHGLHPVFDHGMANPPLWSLAREEYLYLMYPALLLLRQRLPWYTLAGLLAALTIAIQLIATRVATPGWAWLLVTSAPALWIQWHLGVVAADAYRGVIRLPAFWRQMRWVPGWMLLAYLTPPGIVFVGLAYFTVVNACVAREADGRWPTGGMFDALSNVGLGSYSLYLIHHPAQIVALAMTARVLPTVGLAGFLGRAVLLTIVGCIAGRLLFVLVERHFLSVPRRSDRLAPGPAGVDDQSVALRVSP